MRITVFTLAPTLKQNDSYVSYAPYTKEMDIWFSFVDEVTIVSPTNYSKKILLGSFSRKDIDVTPISWIEFTSFKNAIKSLARIPKIGVTMYTEMQKADHIHLRCPGTIGLIACLVQLLFPKKKKTAKYAGNWDPKAKQPLSYRMQKWMLGNTFLTKNMQVLVYGSWEGQTKNIKAFFTASYWDKEKTATPKKDVSAPYKFLFVGSLVPGKRPLYAIQLVALLLKKGVDCSLTLYGDGPLRNALETYVTEHNISEAISFKGNQTAQIIKEAYQKSAFLILPSTSEGWPKVVAEAMFWGTIPLVTKISCVPWMLGEGARGRFLSLDITEDVKEIFVLFKDVALMQEVSQNAMDWSRDYTLNTFEFEIKQLLR